MIIGKTPKPSYLEAWQEDSCLLKGLIWKVQWIETAQALRMTDTQANFYNFEIFKPQSHGISF